jgi:hypothetical protein
VEYKIKHGAFPKPTGLWEKLKYNIKKAEGGFYGGEKTG